MKRPALAGAIVTAGAHRFAPFARWRIHRAATGARWCGALLVLAAGAIHLWLYFDYFHLVHVVGVLFLLNAAAGAVVGAALLLSDRHVVIGAGIAFAAGTLAAFFLSVYHGLFGYVESLEGAWQEAAGSLELAAVVTLAPLLLRRRG